MALSLRDRTLRLSVASLTATAAVVSIHHVYRLGLGVLVPAVILTALPYVLMRWYRASGHRLALWGYAGLTASIFIWFGFVDGFLDHAMKALGLQHTTLLPGGESAVVPTAFSLWSPQAGNLLYEGTGLLEFVLSSLAMYHCYRVLHASRTPRPRARAVASVEGSAGTHRSRKPREP